MKKIRLYNLILPIWFLIWWPSYLWLVLIPLNYLVDSAVIYFVLKLQGHEDVKALTLQHSWQTCLIGFFSDFVGLGIMFGISVLGGQFGFFDAVIDALMWNPFSNIGALLIVLLSIFVSGLLIYWLNKKFMMNTLDISEENKSQLALYLAIATAPYLYLLPTVLFYQFS